MKESILKIKTLDFSVRITNLYKYLCNDKKEFIISKQILRSGTSIGANVSEAIFAASKKDFISKLTVAIKECSESLHWLDLLKKSEYLTDKQYESINKDCFEIGKILNASIKTAKNNLNKAE